MMNHVFGHGKAVIYTIEFQKNGLLHCHFLLTLNEEDIIDQIVSVELPRIS